MKEYLLNAKNLMNTHYDSGSGNHILEFDTCGVKIFVTVRGIGPVDSEFYWYSEETLRAAIAGVSDGDIDVYMGAYTMSSTDGGIVFETIKEAIQ